MKILLVNPWIYDVASFDYWLKPLGLLIIGRYMREYGHDLKLIDCLNRYDDDLKEFTGRKAKSKWNGTGKFPDEIVQKPLSMKHIPRNLKRYGMPLEVFEKKLNDLKKSNWTPDYIFVTSAMTYWYPGPWKAIEILKKSFNDVPVLLGGNYAVLMPEHAKRSGADFICGTSKIDETLEFLSSIGIKTEFDRIDLTPDYSLYGKSTGHLVFLTSLGCPYACTYCATPIIQKFIQMDPDSMVKSILKYVNLYEEKNVAFFDDAILINHEKHFDKILRGIIDAGLPERGVQLHVPNGIHARLLVPETAKLMKQANVKSIKIAIETMDPKRQLETGGKVSNEDFFRAVDILKSVGFTEKELSAFVLMNLPGQSSDEILEALYACRKLGINSEINEYTPIPGTVDYQRFLDRNGNLSNIDPIQLNNTILIYSFQDGLSPSEAESIKSTYKTEIKFWR